MSLHGIQKRLPFMLYEKNKTPMELEPALAVNYASILSRIKEGEKLITFSEVMWPFLFIQAEASYHLMIDDVGLCNFNQKFTNAPRTAQVGHVLRDSNMDKVEKLMLVKQIIKFEKRIKLDNDKEDAASEDEYFTQEINGLVNPKALEGFSMIIPTVAEFKMEDFSSLESLYSFDNALSFAKKFKDNLEICRGNGIRWKTAIKLIEEPIEKWKTDLNVKIKDLEERYRGSIQRAKELDEKTIDITLVSAKDNAGQWLVREQKTIIGKIGRLFVSIDLIFEELRKRNHDFLDTETLKTNDIQDVIQKAFQHVAYIRDALQESEHQTQELSDRLNNIRMDIENSSVSAEDRVKKINANLLDKKQEQENTIRQLQVERESELKKIQEIIDLVTQLFEEISELIKKKIDDCQYDEDLLRKWELHDSKSHIANPTIRYFLPVGIGIINDDDDEERIEICFPQIIGPNFQCTPLDPELSKMEQNFSKILDRNMKIRSNFEFALKKKNLSNDPTLKSRIIKGLDLLQLNGAISVEMQQKTIQNLK